MMKQAASSRFAESTRDGLRSGRTIGSRETPRSNGSRSGDENAISHRRTCRRGVLANVSGERMLVIGCRHFGRGRCSLILVCS